MERRMGELEINVYKSYAVPLENLYVAEMKKMQELHRQACSEAKGKGIKVGQMKNRSFAGMMVAFTKDSTRSAEDKKLAENMMLTAMDDGQGRLDMQKAAKLDNVVGQCSVKLGAKEAYVNLRMHEGSESWGAKLGDALLRDGRRQWDAPTPTPVAKELRERGVKLRRR